MQLCHVVPDANLALAAANSSFLLLDRIDPRLAVRMAATGKPIVTALPGNQTDGYGEYLAQATDVRAALVGCPFVVGDGVKTVAAIKDFLSVYDTLVTKPKLMVIPQGKDWPTYESCLVECYNMQDRFHTYGMPAKLMDRLGHDFTGVDGVYSNRPWLLRKKIMRYIRMGLWEICLLEIDASGAQELAETVGQLERVTRCITGAAFGCALAGRDLAKEGTQHPAPVLQFAPQTKADDTAVALAYRNMQFLNSCGRSIGA